MTTTTTTLTIQGLTIQHDRSGGQGHCWRTCTIDSVPADIREEIAAEIIDGDNVECGDYIATNGEHYRWGA